MAKRKPDQPASTGPPGRPKSASEQLDERQAAAALEKRRSGRTPTRAEAAALKRVEKRRDEQLREFHYATIPQKTWREMSGRQAKVLQEQAERTGIPFNRSEINLADVVRALHDFLAAKKHLLWKPGDPEEDVAMLGESSPALERWREEKYLLAQLERLEKQKQLFPRHVVHEALVRLATILRSAGEQLQKVSPDAGDALNESLDDCDRAIAELFRLANDDQPNNHPHPAGDDAAGPA